MEVGRCGSHRHSGPLTSINLFPVEWIIAVKAFPRTVLHLACLVSLLKAAPALAAGDQRDELLRLVLRVLAHDAAPWPNSGDFVVLAVTRDSGAAQALATGLLASPVRLRGRLVRLEVVSDELPALDGRGADAMLVLPGAPTDLVRRVAAEATRRHLYSLALDEAAVREGVLVGLTLTNQRPVPTINLTTARALGVRLAPALLQLCRTVD